LDWDAIPITKVPEIAFSIYYLWHINMAITATWVLL